MERKIFLTIEAGTQNISYASCDQYKAQQMCHKFYSKFGIEHKVVTEDWIDLPYKLRIQLRKKFNINF